MPMPCWTWPTLWPRPAAATKQSARSPKPLISISAKEIFPGYENRSPPVQNCERNLPVPLNKVNNIRLNQDNTISLDVSVDGFDVNSPIQISGEATQTNGAVASFYAVKTVPPPDGNNQMVVTVESAQ